MQKKSVKVEFKQFTKGLITEASPLNFPPEASAEEENFTLNRDGTRDRRLGLDFEPEHVMHTYPVTSDKILNKDPVTFKWDNVGGDSGSAYLVVQTDTILTFFDLYASVLSDNGYKGMIDLSSFPSDVQYSFASIDGRLVVVSGADTVAVVEYLSDVFAVTYHKIYVRDVWGVAEESAIETDISYRPSILSPSHIYNLYNQSWGIPRRNSDNVLVDPVIQYYNSLSAYPSNSEAVWPGLQFQAVAVGASPYERMFPNMYTEILGASTFTAKGYFIIDALRRGESRANNVAQNKAKYPELSTGVYPANADYSSGGATVVTEFAGRVFYAGFNGTVVDGDSRSPDLSNFVMFSQLVKSNPDISKCYQEGDPTSRESNDLVETDGGFIRISGMNKVIGMVNLSSHLVVLASNGVWLVSGGSDYGFSSTNFKVERISTFGPIGPRTIVEDASKLFYWSENGIYAVGKDQMGSYVAINIVEATIQKYYDSIPNTSKMNCIGVYDYVAKKIKWIYNEGVKFTDTSVSKELVLDLSLNSFYVNRISKLASNNAEVVSIFGSIPFKTSGGTSEVISIGEPVYAGESLVVIPDVARQSGIQASRYLCTVINNVGVYQYTFGYFYNGRFIDWEQVDNVGVDAKAFLVTGEFTADDSSIHKQTPYLTVHFLRTESGNVSDGAPSTPSGCLIRTMWDWSNAYKSNKWSPLVQAYRYRKEFVPELSDGTYDTGFKLVTSKNKVRGRGKAFGLYFESEPLKDCRIIGWNLALNGNSTT